MLDALNGKEWLQQFRFFSSKDCDCTIEELRQAYIQMALNYMNEIVNSKQLQDFISAEHGDEQVEKISVEGALSNRLIRNLCQYPDDLEAQAESAANFIEFNVYK